MVAVIAYAYEVYGPVDVEYDIEWHHNTVSDSYLATYLQGNPAAYITGGLSLFTRDFSSAQGPLHLPKNWTWL